MMDMDARDDNEPDWEQVCAHVKIGDPNYWPCAAKREELEVLKEIREEEPFEKRLMQRAQPIPELPRRRGAREPELEEIEEAPKKRAPKKRASKKRGALEQAELELAEHKPSRGISGFLEQLVAGDMGKYVMWGGPILLLGLYLWSRNRTPSTSALPSADPGKVWAWGVVWKKVDGTMQERMFRDASTATSFAQALQTAGATDIQIASKAVQIAENDAKLLQAAA